MRRGAAFRWGLALVTLASIGGCSDSSRPPSTDATRASAFAPVAQEASGARLAYSHDLTVALGPERVEPHFAAARDRCLGDKALRCVLIRSSIGTGSGTTPRPQARLEVRLPHDSVAAYVAFVTSPLAGEAPGDVVLRDQSTRAEDLTRPIGDTTQRLSQLGDYRSRLKALSERTDTRVEDLIRIANELSQVQAQIEEQEAKRRGLDERVGNEIVSIAIRSDEAREDALGPVREAWTRSGRTLGDSAGSALRFAIASLPWLPIVIIGMLLLRLLWRLRGKRNRPESRPSRDGAATFSRETR